MADFKPTIRKPMSKQSQGFEKNFRKEMITHGLKINETDALLTEKEQSLKKKIFNLPKMEALVFSDPKLSAVYDEMAKNGEERYGYHYSETIMNMLFNDYVLNSPKYLQKYKMAIPKEKKRRDKSGINQLKKAGEMKMLQTGLPKEKEKPKEKVGQTGLPQDVDETTTAGSAGGAAGYVGYAGPAAWGSGVLMKTKGKSNVMRKPIFPGGTIIQESDYLTDPSGFEKFIELLNEDIDLSYQTKFLNPKNPVIPGDKKTFGVDEQSISRDEANNIIIDKTTAFSSDAVKSWNNKDAQIQLNTIKTGKMDTPNLDEKAKSQSQQQFMGMVHAIQRGELSPSEVSPKMRKVAKEMNPEDVEDFARTKHKGLPDKVDEISVGQYIVTVKHDNGTTRIKTAASSPEAAKSNVMRAEGCPENAILNVVPANLEEKSTMSAAETEKAREPQPMKGLSPQEHNPKVYPKMDEYLMPDALIGNDVVDIRPRQGEVPFTMGDGKYQFETATYADGRKDIVVYSFKDDVYYDYEKWRKAMNINEDTQTMIQNNGSSMSNKATPVGDQSANIETGVRSSGGGMSESYDVLLEELNNELNAYSIHHAKLIKMAEDRKPSALVLKDRLGAENEKNFKSDLNKSDTKQIIDVEKELQWKDQQTDVKDPQKLGLDIEKQEIKATDADGKEALKNVGDSANDKGDEVPKCNLSKEERDEVNLYRLGLGDVVFDNEPGKRFEDRMKADMGEELYKQRQDKLEFRGKAPMYNKDQQPVEDTKAKKVQFDKEQTDWNERMGLKESLVSGKYIDVLGKRHIVDFKLNEVKEIKELAPENDLYPLDFAGLGNTYNSKVQVNEDVKTAIESYQFYTDGTKVFAYKPVQNLSGAALKTKPVVNEHVDKMKHLLGYNPKNYVDTSNVKKNRGF